MISRSQQSRPRFFFSSLVFLLIFILSGCNEDNDTSSTPGSDNQQPIAKITASHFSTSAETITLNGSDSFDPDGDELSYQWAQTEGPDIALSDSTSSSLIFVAPSVAQPTLFSFELTVNDGELSSTANISFQLSPPKTSANEQPSAKISATKALTSGETATLDGSGSSDPDGDTLTYRWKQTQGESITLADNSSPTLSFIAPAVNQNTIFTFQLTVDDGYLSSTASVQILVSPLTTDVTPTGIHVSGSQVYEGNGKIFSMRGINVPHAWYPDKTNSSLSDIAKTGANSVRIVLSSGDRWNKTGESTVSGLIEQAKTNKLITILEVHDTTGYGEQSGAVTLSKAVDYWKSIQGALIGQEDYVIINIGNEPLGNDQPASDWTNGHIDAIKSLRSAGFTHALMVDAANWGQDWQNIMRDNAASVLAADPQKNVIFSVHMYQVYKEASAINSYMSTFKQNNLALVVGEFAADHQGEDVDEAAILDYAKQYGYGYLGWSWSGNSAGLESLDIAQDFNAGTLSSWGETLINGTNGIKQTSSTGTIFDGNSTDPLDTDGDGITNDADTDDDGDGVPDVSDAFPLDSTESVDTDGDGIGNNTDTDDDNDGVSDTEDPSPLDSSVSQDTGNNDPVDAAAYKPRVINTTDIGGDPDDAQSMVRQLAISNEYDLEGLIATTGCWRKNVSSTAPIDKIVDAYGEVLPNLQKHADGYPSYEYLKSISVMGQKGYGMGDVGEGKDSAGSELIIAAVDKDDPRPVWVTCWGGCNTIAQAIWKVQNTRSSSELDKFLSKLRVYDVLGQDNAGTWMAKTFPNLFYIRATGVYGWAPSDSWVSENVQSHGPLGKVYPNRKYSTEGDTPSFMHLYPNGLHDPDMVDQGGWGGRFEPSKKKGIRGMDCMSGEDAKYDPYYMYGNTPEAAKAIKQWENGYNNDFEARMDWSVTSNFSDANHHPVAVVNGSKTREILEMTASPGSSVELSTNGSSDPDGDKLSYSWSFDEKPSSYNGSVTIQGGSSETAYVEIPSNAGGKSIHVILEMHDSGSPNLYAYRRVIINVQ